MTKLEIIRWIESLENQAQQSSKFFIERNELYIEKQNLIKYIEDKLNQGIENETEYGHDRDVGMYFAYQDILERIKSGKYET